MIVGNPVVVRWVLGAKVTSRADFNKVAAVADMSERKESPASSVYQRVVPMPHPAR